MKVLFFSLFIFIQTLFAVQSVTFVGDANYPPYSYIEEGEAKGIYVDIIRKAFEKIPEYSVTFKMFPWKRTMSLVKKGRAVAFFPPYYAKERTEWTDYSEPILAERIVVFAKNSLLKERKIFPEDFYGLKACMNRGFLLSVGGEKFKKAVEAKKIERVEGNSNRACLAQVKRGFADFTLNNPFIDTSDFLSIHKGPLASENIGYVGFTLQTKAYPYMKDLQTKFNSAIQKMKVSGEIEAIVKNYE